MAKDKISDYSTTASDNTDISGIGIQGTNAVRNFDDALRTLMKQLADMNAGTSPIFDTFTLCDPVDTTKKVRIDAGPVATGTTRVLTMPDANVTITAFGASIAGAANDAAARTALLAQIALTNTRSVEQGVNLAGAADCFYDFFAGLTGTFSARIIRESGNNGNLLLAQTGTGNIDVVYSGNTKIRVDSDATNSVLIWVNGVLKRVSVGAADSGGVGSRALIVPN